MDYMLKFDKKPDHADELKGDEDILVDVIGPIKGEGWAVNLRIDGELPEELKEFEVFTDNPIRIWL